MWVILHLKLYTLKYFCYCSLEGLLNNFRMTGHHLSDLFKDKPFIVTAAVLTYALCAQPQARLETSYRFYFCKHSVNCKHILKALIKSLLNLNISFVYELRRHEVDSFENLFECEKVWGLGKPRANANAKYTCCFRFMVSSCLSVCLKTIKVCSNFVKYKIKPSYIW